jgi:hypothetical protein
MIRMMFRIHVIGFVVLAQLAFAASWSPAKAVGCGAAYFTCVQSCGGGRLCTAHCDMRRKSCENLKAAPTVGTRPSPTLPRKKIDTGAPKPAGVK